MKVLIIEDEPLLADELKMEITKANSSVEVMGILGSVAEGIQYFKDSGFEEDVDVIFSDIQLSDGLSFEIFQECQISTPVIFCTAFDEYALEAFKSNGIDYILKPFDSSQISNALRKYTNLVGGGDSNVDFKQLHSVIREEIQNSKGSILVSKGDSIIPVSLSEIRLAFIDSSVTYIITVDGSKYVVDETLDHLQKALGNHYFRLNRQVIIHRKAIEKVSRYFSRKLLVHSKIPFDGKLLVSKETSSSFLKWLERA